VAGHPDIEPTRCAEEEPTRVLPQATGHHDTRATDVQKAYQRQYYRKWRAIRNPMLAHVSASTTASDGLIPASVVGQPPRNNAGGCALIYPWKRAFFHQRNWPVPDVSADLISAPATGTNLDIAATDQIRPIATTTVIPIPVRICIPSVSR
jgi:hypothetical protein